MEKPNLEAQFNRRDYSTFIGGDPMRNDYHYFSVDRELGDLTDRKVLDVGCGDGLYDESLAGKGAEVVGYDRAENLIAIARQRNKPGMHFLVSTPEQFEAREEFDCATSIMVLPYAKDPEHLKTFFSSTFRALKPEGKFVSVVFNPEFKSYGKQIGNRRFMRLPENRVEVQFLDPQTGSVAMTAELSQFTAQDYEQAAAGSGFEKSQWKSLATSEAGRQRMGEKFWQDLETDPPYAIFEASK